MYKVNWSAGLNKDEGYDEYYGKSFLVNDDYMDESVVRKIKRLARKANSDWKGLRLYLSYTIDQVFEEGVFAV